MRIVLALEYPLMQQGGTEVLVRELVRRLGRRFKLLLVTGDPAAAQVPGEFANLVDAHLSWDAARASRTTAESLARRISQWRPDLAHFHFGSTYEWSTNKFWKSPLYHLAGEGVPMLSTNHLASPWLDCGCNPARPLWQKVLIQTRAWLSRAIIYRRLRREMAVSQHDCARLRAMFPLFRGKIGRLYHSLLDADGAPAVDPVREPVILCVGTIGGRKGQPILAQAFARIAPRHPDWRLELIGRCGVAVDSDCIHDIIRRYKLHERMTLAGWQDNETVLRRMRSAAVFVMPSLEEGLGLSLQEALFHGCVAVGSRCGGIPELIDHEANGLLVPPGDADALSAALERLMNDNGLRQRLAGHARESIVRKGMTAQAMAGHYQRIYAELAGATPGSTL